MTAHDVRQDPLYASLTEHVGQELAVELLHRLPPPGSDPATRRDVADLGTRLDGLQQCLDALEQRLDALEQRLDALEQRLDAFEDRVTRSMERFDDKLERFHEGLRDQTRNVLLANAGMMLTLAAILVAVGVVG